MQRRDRPLHLVGPRPAVAHGLVDEGKALGDHLVVPEVAILIGQQDDAPVGVEPRGGACMLEQKEGGETHDLRLGLEQAQQQSRQPDGLVAKRRAHMRRAAARRIALVEQQIDHGSDGAQSFGALGCARRLERHLRLRNPALRPGDALLHGHLAHQEGARDLRDRQARHDAQRERDLLGGREIGMAADEQQPQDVIAIVPIVEAFDQRDLGVVQIRHELLGGERLLLAPAPRAVDCDVAPDEDEPGGRVARRAVLRPGLERPQARFLKRLFGDVEVAKIAQQRRDRLRTGGGQRRIDPCDIGHVAAPPGRNTDTGRIS